MSFELREFPIPEFPRLTHFGYCISAGSFTFDAHRHLGYEFVYIESGAADVVLLAGSNAVCLSTHDCVLTPPGVEHCFSVDGSGMSFFWAGIQTDDVVQTSDSNILPPRALLGRQTVRVQMLGPDRRYGDLRRLAESLHIDKATVLSRVPEIGSVMRAIEQELVSSEGSDHYLVYIKVLELFALFRKRLSSRDIFQNASSLVRSVVAHVSSSLTQRLSNAELAAYSGVSVRQLHRLFRSELGVSPAALVERLRIEEACRLLSSGYRSVDVLQRTGFSSAEHFHRRFRLATGVTPKQYRRGADSRAGAPATAPRFADVVVNVP